MVPRHVFMDPAFLSHAIQIRLSYFIRTDDFKPYTVAIQTSLLKVKKRDKVLEVGTGSGYQAAVLAEMGVRVIRLNGSGICILKPRERFRNLAIMPTSFMATGMKERNFMVLLTVF